MSYTPYYPNGWKAGEEGATPITPDALNHYDASLKQQAEALAKRLPMPANAQAGQFLKVSEVDESGKVTAVEAVTIGTYTGEVTHIDA